jgi:capsular polysaccharide biosynthesis protein
VITPTGVPRVRDYFLFVKNSWLLVLVTTIVSAAVGWVNWENAKPEYQSTASAFVNMLGLMETYRQLATSTQITAPIIQKLGLIESDKELASRIVILPSATAMLNVTVTGGDADQTTQIAHEVVSDLVTVGNRLALVAGTSATLVVIDDAGPAERVGGVWSYVMTGAALGFALCVLAVIARALILDRVQSRRHLERVVTDASAGTSG